MKKRAWLLHFSLLALVVAGCSRSLGVVDDLAAEAQTITPPNSVELMRYERDSIEVFGGQNQSGGVGVLWASDLSLQELTAHYGSLDVLAGGSSLQRGTRRFEYDAYNADRTVWLSVTVYRENPEAWPAFDTPQIDVPTDKTIVLVTTDYTLD